MQRTFIYRTAKYRVRSGSVNLNAENQTMSGDKRQSAYASWAFIKLIKKNGTIPWEQVKRELASEEI
ncbi:hypothetical protein WA1_31605 [Scytonema hofmannii PCC 7110]|uniref:Uncharacterized protein n=1 Tax=Scytonema hofmannii PCC 7110 TaxID=128403 RepID=A0A139X3P9_9CYAN|nr:hypothetical protein [Scytonema hofmannii]KYC39286.1 hypothetical protein WA1_31605 [Scytonema hofmannii PCC 7110]